MATSPGTTPDTRYVDHEGVSIAYVEAGVGDPPILLVHGMACDHTHLLPQFHHLRTRHRVIAVDLRGHGASDRPGGAYTGEILGDDLAFVCRSLGLDHPVVVGHSLGGSVSLALAVRQPELLGGLVLLDSGIRRPQAKRQELQPFYDSLGGPDHAELVSRFVAQRLCLPTDGEEIVRSVARTMAATPAHVFLAMAEGVVAFDSQAAALACRVPALLVMSGQPFVDPAAVAALPDNWEVARVAGAGHFVQLVVPDQVNAMLDRFLHLLAGPGGRHDPGRPTRHLSARAQSAPPVPRSPASPVRYDFGQGLPDPALFPVADLRRCLAETAAAGDIDAFGYFGRAGGVEEMRYGSLDLRLELARWIGRRDGTGTGPDEVVLTQGSIDGLALAVATLAGPGDGAVVEAATFPYVPRFLADAGATVRTVPLDGDGMVVAELDAQLAALASQGHPPRVVYTIPSFHSPTGTVLPVARRRQLLAVARRWGATVIEDNCYHEFSYGSPPPPTLLALDAGRGTVVQADTFSKLVAPGLRLGWLSGDAGLMESVARTRHDFAVSQTVARGLAQFLAEGLLEPHLDRVRAAYRRKWDVAVDTLRHHCAPSVTFAVPTGGFYFWLALAGGIDPQRAVDLALERGVSLRPGSAFGDGPDTAAHLRMAVVQVPEADIAPGVRVLGQVLAESRR